MVQSYAIRGETLVAVETPRTHGELNRATGGAYATHHPESGVDWVVYWPAGQATFLREGETWYADLGAQGRLKANPENAERLKALVATAR